MNKLFTRLQIFALNFQQNARFQPNSQRVLQCLSLFIFTFATINSTKNVVNIGKDRQTH